MSGTVIDAFLVTLGLDTKEFHTGVDQSKRDQDELRKNTEENVGKMKESYQGLIEKVGQLFALLAGGHELKEFFNSTQENEVATLRLSEMIGMSVEKLGQWQGALVVNGGSAEGFNQSMKTMGGFLIDIENHLPRAERALKAFKAAGINLEMGKKSDILEVLDQVQDRFKKLTLMEGRELGRRMGLDENFARMLHDSDDSLKDLLHTMEEIGTPTKEEAEAMERLERAQKTLGIVQGALGRIIVDMLAPAIKFVTDKLLEFAMWAKDHPQIIKTAFIGIAGAISVLGAAAGAAMIPMLGITAALSGVALGVGMIASGLYMLWQQNDSWLHDLVTWIQGVGMWFEIVWERIGSTTLIVLKALWENIENIGRIVADVLELVVSLFTMNGEHISKAWEKLTADVNQMFKMLWNSLVFGAVFAFYSIEAAASALWNNMKAPAEAFFNWVISKFSWLNAAVSFIKMLSPSSISTIGGKESTQPGGRSSRVMSMEPANTLAGTPSSSSPAAGVYGSSAHTTRAGSIQSTVKSPVLDMPVHKQVAANHLAAIGGLPPEVPAAKPVAATATQNQLLDPTSKEAAAFNRQFSFMGATPHAAMAAPAAQPSGPSTTDNSKREVSVGQVNVYAAPGADAQSIADTTARTIRNTGMADQVDGGI
jgi:hypothetical protein